MFCTRCGSKIRKEDRCCLKCGAINIEHPDNQGFIKRTGYKSMANSSLVTVGDSSDDGGVAATSSLKVNSFSKSERQEGEAHIANGLFENKIFLIVNIIVFILGIVFINVFSSHFNQTIIGLADYIVYFIASFYVICFEILFDKAELPWWGMFIPIYNIYLIYKLAFGTGDMFFLLICLFLFPIFMLFLGGIFKIAEIVNSFAFVMPICSLLIGLLNFIMLFNLGRSFGRSGLITLIFGYVVLPMVAFSSKYEYTR